MPTLRTALKWIWLICHPNGKATTLLKRWYEKRLSNGDYNKCQNSVLMYSGCSTVVSTTKMAPQLAAEGDWWKSFLCTVSQGINTCLGSPVNAWHAPFEQDRGECISRRHIPAVLEASFYRLSLRPLYLSSTEPVPNHMQPFWLLFAFTAWVSECCHLP